MTIEIKADNPSAIIPINHDHPGDEDPLKFTEVNLRPDQDQALKMMLAGKTDGEIAARLGVTRQTVNYWRNRDDNFRQVLCTERQEAWQAIRNEMSAMYTEALGILRKYLQSKDPKLQLKAAMQVLNLHDLKAAIVDADRTSLKVMDLAQQMSRLEAGFARRQMKNAAEEERLNKMTFEEYTKELEQQNPGNKFRR